MHLRFVICWVLLNLGKSKQSEGESFFLRLVDGDSICSGRVELFYNETWGTICDDYWDMPDAVVVCRQIQCGFAQSARGSSQFGEGPGVIWLDDVECVGSESNLRQCKIRTVGEHNCNHVEDAGVICNPEHPPKPSIYSGKKSGVFIKGEDLKIKCSTLGFYTATMFYLYKDNGPLPLLTKSPASRHFTATFHLANITDGHSGNYSCRYDSNISGKTYSSEQSENVDIMLREYLPAPEIVYSQASNVIIEGQDITLRCQTQEKYEQCRFHLYKDDETNPIDSQMASNTQSFVLFNVTEIGQQDEGSYFCKYEVIVNKQLQFNSSFSTHLNITVQDGVKLRLSNRDSACEGELEVLYNATWGKVCGRGWHISEAEVVCRHLGCGFGKSAVSTERYGFGTDDVKLNYVHCQGTEKLLWNCRSLSWSENTCFDHFRAHVTCSEQPLKPSVTVYRMPSIYMPGENVTIQCTIAPYYIGSQMFLHKVGEKKALLSVPVPPNQKSANFTIVDVQTKQTGNYTCSYDIDISETVFKSEPSDPQAITVRDEPPEPTLSVEKDPPNYLPGQEISLQCRAPVYFTVSQYYLYKDTKNNFVRSHLVTDQDIPAVFQITAENSKEEGEYMCQYETNSTGKLYNSTLSDHIKISVAADIKLRLADGGRPCSGRIECFVNDTWATICDEEWDLAEAEVACRQLHCGFARSATRSGSFGEGSGPAWAKNIACNGTETYLWVCPYEAVYPQLCPMRNDVGVVCSDQPLQPAIYIRRPSGRFSQGENVTIDCKAPSFYQGATFFLYKTNQEAYLQSLKADDNSNTVAFLLTKISTFHEGSYTCSYQVVRDGRPSTSDISSQVKISVIDKPPKPRIDFVASLGQFSIGETALVRCIAPSAYYGVTFVLSKVENSGYITTAIVKTPGYSTILYIKDIRSKSQGDYVCMYQITRSGIVYNSTLSERKSLTVSGKPCFIKSYRPIDPTCPHWPTCLIYTNPTCCPRLAHIPPNLSHPYTCPNVVIVPASTTSSGSSFHTPV
ncbi:deleted in malignant brain tumors 1 protein-like [Leucoraja erinacea]|uniref:deleted in malignant brain tumors 1 protein-like n=1 Tax=Leucoraja erinaceus TaxID=7782 RepID=UPI0024583734|nr:deleted in malignant brain tumors 1 protein-like [Leucoraja erinacea]